MALQLMSEGDRITVCETDLPGIMQPDPEVSYTIQKMLPTEHRQLVKQHTRQEFVRGQGRVDITNTDALMDDMLDRVLVGWSGILLQGQPAPCTRDLKVRGLDWERKKAILDKAGANEIAREPERRAESFPPTA
jgi:hypothetical protein